jgi:two-component system, NarL family, invasion response regulator UvrY
MINLLIVDDHPFVRRGLITTLEEFSDIRVAGEAASAEEALHAIRHHRYDVVLLDISLPGRSGLDLLKQLHDEFPTVRVLILSTYPEDLYGLRCLQAGAWGYITKDSAPNEVVEAIHKIAQGRKHAGPKLAERLADLTGFDVSKPLHERLSNREFEILCLIGQGRSTADIAALLDLSKNTVHSFRSRIMAKMRMRSTPQLILYVLQNHLVEKL